MRKSSYFMLDLVDFEVVVTYPASLLVNVEELLLFLLERVVASNSAALLP